MENLTKTELLKEIIEDIENDISDEEIIRLILERRISVSKSDEIYTFGQKAADKLARIAGSWYFVITFVMLLIVWIVLNANMHNEAFDPYPFILLNLALSCLAALQAPLIMMSQNRQEKKDRIRAESDYRVNLKTEIIIQDIHDKLDVLIESQSKYAPTADP